MTGFKVTKDGIFICFLNRFNLEDFNNNILKTFGTNEGCDILAVLELEPTTKDLRVLWDKTDVDTFTDLLNLFTDGEWQDKMIYRNPNIWFDADKHLLKKRIYSSAILYLANR